MTNGAPAAPPPAGPAARKSFFDDWVLTLTMLLGLGGPVAIYGLGIFVPPLVVAFLLACGVSALVYRFLGGIGPETTFVVGASKVGGSLAALLLTATLAYDKLPEIDPDHLLSPPPSNWIAVSYRDASPVSLEVLGHKVTADPGGLSNVPLAWEKTSEGFVVTPKSQPGFKLGRLGELPKPERARLTAEGLWVTGRLEAGSSERMGPLNLLLVTGQYAGGYSEYELRSLDGPASVRGSIQGRGSAIMEFPDGRCILVAVAEVDHQSERPYAKFVIERLVVQN